VETYRLPTVNNRPLVPADMGVYADIRFDADDTAPTYIGLHLLEDAPTSDTNWKIYKFTYGSGTAITRIQLAYASWDGRGGAF